MSICFLLFDIPPEELTIAYHALLGISALVMNINGVYSFFKVEVMW